MREEIILQVVAFCNCFSPVFLGESMQNNYVQMALQLALKGKYLASPNPLVGCVIEKNNKVIGTGWHKGVGFPHAEIEALNQAGKNAKNSNVYINLEPCCHFGKTPPCVDALIKAQAKSVHIPFIDPNPLVNGKSVAKLKQAGIKVYIGEEAEKARQLNEVFLHYISTKKPFVIAKWAMTLDGKIATQNGDSKWITNLSARKYSHKLRQKVDAILVGVNTVIKDNPKLTPHLVKAVRQPLRIILDPHGRTPTNSSVLQSMTEKTLIVTQSANKKWRDKIKNTGATIWQMQIDLNNLLERLGKQKISSILIEGGTKTLSSFFKAKLVNKVYSYIAPKIIGDDKAFAPLLGLNVNKISQSLKLNITQTKKLGDDLLAISYPDWGN